MYLLQVYIANFVIDMLSFVFLIDICLCASFGFEATSFCHLHAITENSHMDYINMSDVGYFIICLLDFSLITCLKYHKKSFKDVQSSTIAKVIFIIKNLFIVIWFIGTLKWLFLCCCKLRIDDADHTYCRGWSPFIDVYVMQNDAIKN